MADYYGTLERAAAYHTARGNSAWANSTDPLRTAAMVRASSAIDLKFATLFPGTKTGGRDQIQQWPRTGVAIDLPTLILADDETPLEIEWATYEGALRELVKPGSLMPDVAPGSPIVKRERIEGVAEREFFISGATSTTFTAIDALLAPILLSRGSPLFGTAIRR